VTPKSKIFVVDDDIGLLTVIEELLREEYEVSLAKSGAQAVRFLEKGGLPDLILLDIEMSGMDGFETLLTLRSSEAGSEIPVIYRCRQRSSRPQTGRRRLYPQAGEQRGAVGPSRPAPRQCL